MPVILDKGYEDRWSSPDPLPEEMLSLLMPLPDGRMIALPAEAFTPARLTQKWDHVS